MNTLEHLDHAYGTHQVFEDMRIELPETGTVALRGPNGSGKTTLLKLLGGVLRNASPAITQWRGDHRATYIDAEYLTLDYLTVTEMLATVAPIMRGTGGSGSLHLVDQAMAPTRLGDLSLGQRQRLVLTIALGLKDTDILLLDEPLNGLDTSASAMARQLLGDYGRNRLVIVATHESDHWTDFDLVLESSESSRLFPAGVMA